MESKRMRVEEFIKEIANYDKESLKKGIPVGKDAVGNILLAQKQEKPLTVRNTCVTGVGRTNFVKRLILTLASLYEKNEACFFILSPRNEYGELIRFLKELPNFMRIFLKAIKTVNCSLYQASHRKTNLPVAEIMI